jgi:PPOX class probable FMN-dependent enzyme
MFGMSEWMQELLLLAAAEYHGRPIVATLATADAGGSPRARMVIVRRFDGHDNSIWMTTDNRSEKMAHLHANPAAELVLWTPHERQQFRVRGHADIVRDGAMRLEMWSDLSEQSRATFFWPQPGEPRSTNDRFVDAISSAVPPPETFVLLALRPTDVDALELNESPHRRRRWKQTNGWQVELINP